MTTRKHIRPADPLATIPDPARGRDLPADGLPCTWSVHWARLAGRGDVIVTDLPEAEEATPPAPAPPGEGDVGNGESRPTPTPDPGAAAEPAPEPEEHPDA